jgi:glycosyltransferase involved in cell wall biosynthesis
MAALIPMHLAVVASHPIQYQAPLFRVLARMLELDVFFAHRASAEDQAAAGFGIRFDWDVDLLSGYRHIFLKNVSQSSGPHHFRGCDTPDIGTQLDSSHYDAVLVMGWHLKSFWQAIWAARLRGIPVLIRGDSQLLTHRSKIKQAAKKLVYPIALRSFNAALYVGQRSKQYYEHYNYRSDRLFFSPHCVDTGWFAARATPQSGRGLRSRLGVGADETLILFAGRLVEMKRPLDVVLAAAQLRRSGNAVSLLVAGSGPLYAEMQREAVILGIPIYMLGFQNQTAMPSAYAAADLLVLPSSSEETWGLVANEALACGKPIVVSDAVGCAPDLAGDGSAGRIFPMGDHEQLANAIRDLISTPPKVSAIARKSAAFSLTAACDGIVAGVREVVSVFPRERSYLRA